MMKISGFDILAASSGSSDWPGSSIASSEDRMLALEFWDGNKIADQPFFVFVSLETGRRSTNKRASFFNLFRIRRRA